MMTDRIVSDAYKMKKLIREAEAVTDEAALLYAKLKQTMIGARQNPDVPVATGQAALRRLGEAEASLFTASSNLFRVHKELSSLAEVYAGADDIPTDIIPSAYSDTPSVPVT